MAEYLSLDSCVHTLPFGPLFWGVPLLVWLLTAFLGLGFETLPITTALSALEHFKKTFNLYFMVCAHTCVCVYHSAHEEVKG